MTAFASALKAPGPADETRLALEFLNDVLGQEPGHRCIIAIKSKRHHWAGDNAGLLRLAEDRRDEQGIYFGTALFKSSESRRADNVVSRRAFCWDIDAGPDKVAKHGLDKVYADRRAALGGLLPSLKLLGILPAWIIESGPHGMHVYFNLSEPAGPPDWLRVANKFKRATNLSGLLADDAVTADCARVLRLPGSLHHSGHRAAVLMRTPKAYGLAEFEALLDAALAKLGAGAEVIDFSQGPRAAPRVGSQNHLLIECADDGFTERTVVDLGSALAHIATHEGAPGYEGWTRVGHALKSLKGTVWESTALDLWMKFSRQRPDFDDDATALRKWHELGGDQSSYRVVFTIARATGWTGVAAPDAAIDNESLAAAIARMNTRYFVASDATGRPAIWHESTDPETGTWRLAPLTRAELMLTHENESVTITSHKGESHRVPLAQWWLRHSARRQYPGGMALLPGKDAPAGVFNLWRGFGVASKAGDVSPMLGHIAMLCGGARESAAYVIGWQAYCVQFPDRQPEVAVVIRGGQGTGKGTVFRLLVRIFGAHGLHITHQSHLVGNFNAHLRHALFVFVDEGFWAGDRAAEGVLKGLITEPTFAVEQKGRDVFQAVNRLKVGIASNSVWVIPAGVDERRYYVIDAASTKAKDLPYFDRLNRWIENGGAEAWLDYLLHYDLTGFNPRAVPVSAALDRQKLENLPPLDRWIMEALDQGVALAGTGDWLDDGQQVVCAAAVREFADYCKRAGGRWAQADARVIGERLNRIFECGPSRTAAHGHQRAKAWRLPGLTRARQMAGAAFGLHSFTWGQS